MFEAESILVTAVIRHPIKRARMVGPTTPNFQGVPLQRDATSGLKKKVKKNITCKIFCFTQLKKT